jgi:signal transduction histidine kinase
MSGRGEAAPAWAFCRHPAEISSRIFPCLSFSGYTAAVKSDTTRKPEKIDPGKTLRDVRGLGLSILPTFAGHALALVQFISSFSRSGLTANWLPQGVFLIALSAAVAYILVLGIARGLSFWPTLGFRCLVYLLAVYPSGATLGFELTLLATLVYEIVLVAEVPASAIISTAMTGITLLVSMFGTAWYRTVPRPNASWAITLALFPAVVMSFSVALKRMRGFALNQRRLIAQLNNASLMLMETNVSLQDHILVRDAHVLELERNRISRELHDTVGYTLMNIIATQKAAYELSKRDADEARRFISQSITQAEQGLKETRMALRVLRERAPDVPSLPDAVDRLVRAFDHTHIRIVPHYGNLRQSYGQEVDQAMFKFIQEAITNAIKHGNATRIDISFWNDDRRLVAVVRDDGDGMLPGERLQEGLGMKGMHERMEGLGGEIFSGNTLDGFRIRASVPLPVQAHG